MTCWCIKLNMCCNFNNLEDQKFEEETRQLDAVQADLGFDIQSSHRHEYLLSAMVLGKQ